MATPSSDRRPRVWGFWTPILICLVINTAIGITIAIENPEYLLNSRLNKNPDALHYIRLGRNLLDRGYYSRAEMSPYAPDMLRTPIYPLFSGGLDKLGKALAIYLAQALLQVASCAVIYRLVQQHFGDLAAFLAALLVATDVMWAISNFEALSEPLFVFLVLWATERLSKGLFSESEPRTRLSLLAQAGGLLGLAILTRPVGLYMPVFVLLFVLLWRRSGSTIVKRVAEASVFTIGSFALPLGWIVRNYLTFAVPALTQGQFINLIYFVGAGAYQVEFHLEREAAQQVIAQEFGLFPYHVYQNNFSTDYSVKRMVADLRRTWPHVVFKYPSSLIKSSILGFIKSIGSHNSPDFADMTRAPWVAPGTEGLVRLKPEAFARLAENRFWSILAFFWQEVHTLISWPLAALGILASFRPRRGRSMVVLWLVCLGYYSFTITLFGLDAYSRSRFPVLPFLYLFAGVGAAHLVSRVRRVQDEPGQ